LKDIVRTEKLRQASILHIAPEPNLQKWLQSISSKYIAGDAFLQNQKFIGDVRYVDICSTKFENNEFDYIICNHVICDIKNDIKALNELYRILNYNGIAILQVPVTKIANTVEYDNVQTKEEREIAYGYGYHERIYNDIDYIRLLGETGFEVEVCNYYKDFGLYGLNEKEDLYVCKKLIS
jgi:Methyltransferase domain.